jgi:hypothetical protein
MQVPSHGTDILNNLLGSLFIRVWHIKLWLYFRKLQFSYSIFDRCCYLGQLRTHGHPAIEAKWAAYVMQAAPVQRVQRPRDEGDTNGGAG